MYLSLLGTKERKEYQIDEPLPVIPAFRETLKNKPFLIMALTYTLMDCVFAITLIGLPLYAKFVLKMDDALIGFSAVGIALGALISIPFWRWIYANKGPKYGLLLAIGIFAGGIWLVFLIKDFILLVFIFCRNCSRIPGACNFPHRCLLLPGLRFSTSAGFARRRP